MGSAPLSTRSSLSTWQGEGPLPRKIFSGSHPLKCPASMLQPPLLPSRVSQAGREDTQGKVKGQKVDYVMAALQQVREAG